MGVRQLSDEPERLRQGLAPRYELDGTIGHGGMAVVYRARDLRHQRDVAVKVLRADLAASLGIDRFLREVEITAQLQHPNILPVHDSGRVGDTLFYVMPLVDGESLRARLAREGQLPLEEALKIATEVADALGYAHARGLVHRDIKPENILLSSGHAIVADFGLVRAISQAAGEELTAKGIAVGTPEYMSPEQAGGDTKLDGRSDVYSLGCVLYEMLVGEPPFSGPTAQSVLARHMQERIPSVEVVRPATPPHVIRAVRRALAKVPADRFRTAQDFIRALTTDEAVAAGRGWLVRLIVLAVPVAVALMAVLVWLAIRPQASPLDSRKVAIFPLVERGLWAADTSAGYDVAITLSWAFEHTEPLKWIDMLPRLPVGLQGNPVSLTSVAASALARNQGAAYYLDGVVQRAGDVGTVVLRLHDAAADTLVGQESQRGSLLEESFSQLSLAAVCRLLPTLIDPGRIMDVSCLSHRQPDAIASWILGERAYRLSHFASAIDFYTRAVQRDSLLVFAALKGGQAAGWTSRLDEAEPLIRLALSHDSLLPRRSVPFARGLYAYVTGQADTAVKWLDSAIAVDPASSEAHMALGEVYYHLLPVDRSPIALLAEESFVAAVNADTGYTPPLFHLSELALRSGNVERAESLVARWREVDPEPELYGQLTIMLECVRDGEPLGGWPLAAVVNPLAALRAAVALASGGAQPDCAEDGFRAVLANADAGGGNHHGAFLGLHGTLVARGHYEEAFALVDSMVEAGWRPLMMHYMLDAMLGLPADSQALEVQRFLRGATGPYYERMRHVPTKWILGHWHASRGEVPTARLIAGSLLEESQRLGAPTMEVLARGVEAHAALAEGDTATSLTILRGIRSFTRRDSLEWETAEPHPIERMLQAELLYRSGEYADAIAVASGFDHPGPIIYLAFLRSSLELRRKAADRLGQRGLIEAIDRLLKLLD
jgi:tetratricopeptide (TPR) repeat protein